MRSFNFELFRHTLSMMTEEETNKVTLLWPSSSAMPSSGLDITVQSKTTQFWIPYQTITSNNICHGTFKVQTDILETKTTNTETQLVTISLINNLNKFTSVSLSLSLFVPKMHEIRSNLMNYYIKTIVTIIMNICP